MTEPAAPLCLRLLGRADCGLCEEFAQALFEHAGAAVALEPVDVDSDPILARRYGLRVPVLLDAWGETLCEAHFDAGALDRALLEHARRR